MKDFRNVKNILQEKAHRLQKNSDKFFGKKFCLDIEDQEWSKKQALEIFTLPLSMSTWTAAQQGNSSTDTFSRTYPQQTVS